MRFRVRVAAGGAGGGWMPFTANRQFKQAPRLLVAREGHALTARDGRQVLDGTAGLWCVNAGHGREKIINAVRRSSTLDFAPTFQMGHPMAFEAAPKIAALAPSGLDHVFFTNSGSEAGDTRSRSRSPTTAPAARARAPRLIGRERGYHGVGFGGISVGGMTNNRKTFGNLLPRRRPSSPHPGPRAARPTRAASRSMGPHFADELERIVALHDASNIAAVIVEPVAGSDRRARPAQGLSRAPARDLRQARHPAHFR